MTAGLTAPTTATSSTAVSRGCQTRASSALAVPDFCHRPCGGTARGGGGGCSRPRADDRPPFLGLLGAPFGAGGAESASTARRDVVPRSAVPQLLGRAGAE